MRKTISVLIMAVMLISMMSVIFRNQVFAVTQTRDNKINNIDNKKYPGIKSMILNLQKKYPSWKFKVLYTGLDWNTVIKKESKHGSNLVPKGYTNWICPTCGTKGYSGSNWVCASSNAIAYMMDPRNSLYYEDVFQFLELSYDTNTTYDTNIIKSILKDSFLDNGKLDTYINTIINRCREKNVNPYYIAGKIIQEQGKKGGSTWKMKTTVDGKTVYYYNIFNINACGTTTSAIINNALTWAKAKGWNTIEKCLNGGVDFIANGYITVGQDTMYFEKFDVIANDFYSHQYAQDVLYAQNQGEKIRRILENIGAVEYAYTFVIPLYENMPKTACARPTANGTQIVTTYDSITSDVVADETMTDEMGQSYEMGDPNNDGKINSGDLLMLKQYLIKAKEIKDDKALTAMDINKDTKINSGDLLLIKRHLLGTYKIK